MSNRRLSRTDTLRFVLPRVVTFLLAAALLLGFGWYVIAADPYRDTKRCLRAYDEARNPADTAAVDGIRLGGRMNGNSCGRLRRRGMLELYRARRERRARQDPGAAGLTEK